MIRLLTHIFILCIVFLPGKIYALAAIEVLTGYLEADIRDKDKYIGLPLLVSLDFDAKGAFNKIGINIKGDPYFIIEPFLNTIVSPNKNVEAGTNFLIKYKYPLTCRLQPYLKGGLGFVYMSQHTKEQATQYNFLPQFGGGFHFFIKKNFALNCEYRYRHLSNAGFKRPNKGIDTDMILGGIAYFF